MSVNASMTSGASLVIYVGIGVGLAALGVMVAGCRIVRRARRIREQRAAPATNHTTDPTLSPYEINPLLEATAHIADTRQRLKMDLTLDKERRDSLHPYTVRPSPGSHGGDVSPPPKAVYGRRGDGPAVGHGDNVGEGNGPAATRRRSLPPETDVAELAQLGAEARRAGFSVTAIVQSLRRLDHQHDVEQPGSRPPVYCQ